MAAGLEGRTLHSLATTPAGWRVVAWAKRLFYGILAVALAAIVTAVLHPAALAAPSFWAVLLIATPLYLGVAFAIATTTTSVASAGLGVTVYALLAGGLYAVSLAFTGSTCESIPPHLSPESGLWRLLQDAWSPREPETNTWVIVTLVLWANVWHQCGASCYRRLLRQ